MDLLINKDAKRFFMQWTLVLLAGAILTQILVYMNTVQLKHEMLQHDYELAGYLNNKYPHLAAELPSVFTADKTKNELEAGKALLETSGYKDSLQMRFIPVVNSVYQTNVIMNFIVSTGMSIFLFIVAFTFLKKHYKKIDRYQKEVYEIMNGSISARLDDNEEGSLSKLAASINTVTASLHTHIEKEKHNRLFLKETLTNVSHQLKTPLSALAIYNEIMRGEHLDNEVIESFLKKSEGELERMQTLITNLLKLAKLDAGIIELHKSECVLNDLIKQATTSFETRLIYEQKNFEMRTDGVVSYWCDKEWLLEAVSNLIKNAVEHTTARNCIEVHLEETPLMVKLAVYDDGEGIHPDDLNHVFKPFYHGSMLEMER